MLEQAREVIQREMEEETYDRLRKIKKSVMEQMPGSFSSCGSLDLRKKYISMPAAEVTLEVFSNAEGMFTSKIAKVGSNTDSCLLLMIRYINKNLFRGSLGILCPLFLEQNDYDTQSLNVYLICWVLIPLNLPPRAILRDNRAALTF